MTVARILAAKGRDVISTQPHRTLAEAAALLAARNIGAAVVTDAQGRVLGMLSERDILHAVGTGGAEFYAVRTLQPNSEVIINTAHGVLALALDAGRYAWSLVAADGTTRDEGAGSCH